MDKTWGQGQSVWTCADCFLHACWKNVNLALAEHQEKINPLRSGVWISSLTKITGFLHDL